VKVVVEVVITDGKQWQATPRAQHGETRQLRAWTPFLHEMRAPSNTTPIK
jgi:hypothetical protein